MGVSFWPPRFRADVTGISPKEVPSKSWKRNGLIIRVCTARSSIPAGTLSLLTQTRRCRSRPEGNSFPRRCITSCDLLAPTECMPDIYLVIQRRTAVFGCRSRTRLHSSMQSLLALQSWCMEGRRQGATLVNRGRHFQGALIDFEIRASIQDLCRLRHLGGGDKSNFLVVGQVQAADTAAATEEGK